MPNTLLAYTIVWAKYHNTESCTTCSVERKNDKNDIVTPLASIMQAVAIIMPSLWSFIGVLLFCIVPCCDKSDCVYMRGSGCCLVGIPAFVVYSVVSPPAMSTLSEPLLRYFVDAAAFELSM